MHGRPHLRALAQLVRSASRGCVGLGASVIGAPEDRTPPQIRSLVLYPGATARIGQRARDIGRLFPPRNPRRLRLRGLSLRAARRGPTSRPCPADRLSAPGVCRSERRHPRSRPGLRERRSANPVERPLNDRGEPALVERLQALVARRGRARATSMSQSMPRGAPRQAPERLRPRGGSWLKRPCRAQSRHVGRPRWRWPESTRSAQACSRSKEGWLQPTSERSRARRSWSGRSTAVRPPPSRLSRRSSEARRALPRGPRASPRRRPTTPAPRPDRRHAPGRYNRDPPAAASRGAASVPGSRHCLRR